MNQKSAAIYISLNLSFNCHIKLIIELYISILNSKLTDYKYNYIY